MLFPLYIIRSERQLWQEQLGLPALSFWQVVIKLSLLTKKLRRKRGENCAKSNHTCLKVFLSCLLEVPKVAPLSSN